MTAQPPGRQFLPTLSQSATSIFSPIHREFDRLFEQLGAGWSNLTEFGASPRMDVRDTADGLEITMEVPGIAQDDLKITVEDNLLTVSGEKKSETEKSEKDYRVSERVYGAFSRSVGLPSSVDAEKITATMDKGVLKLVAPKNGKAQAKTISIKAK